MILNNMHGGDGQRDERKPLSSPMSLSPLPSYDSTSFDNYSQTGGIGETVDGKEKDNENDESNDNGNIIDLLPSQAAGSIQIEREGVDTGNNNAQQYRRGSTSKSYLHRSLFQYNNKSSRNYTTASQSNEAETAAAATVQMKEQSSQTMSLSTRIQMESANDYHFFSLLEDYDYNAIDVQKSFAPALPTLIPLVLRCYWLGTSIVFTYQDYQIETGQNGHDPILYFSHLTNITLMFTIAYQVTSCFLTLVASFHLCTGRTKHHYVLYQPTIFAPSYETMQLVGENSAAAVAAAAAPTSLQSSSSSLSSIHSNTQSFINQDNNISQINATSNHTTNSVQSTNRANNISSITIITKPRTTRPSLLVCINWFLYTIVQPAELVIALGYWLYEAPPYSESDLLYTNIYKHGIIAILLLIDGNVIGRIPIRIKHLFVFCIYEHLYLFYSIFFGFSENFGLRHNHGIIYNNLNWKRDSQDAIYLAVVLLYVISPLVFMFCYLLSLLSLGDGRRVCCGNGGSRPRNTTRSEGGGEAGYCCCYSCCYCCCTTFFYDFSFQGGRRILSPLTSSSLSSNNRGEDGYDEEDSSMTVNNLKGSSGPEKEQPRYITSRSRKNRRKGSKIAKNRNNKSLNTSSGEESISLSQQYKHQYQQVDPHEGASFYSLNNF